MRRPALRATRPEGQAVPGPAVGVSALPAGGVRPAARTQPAAPQGVLLPPMAPDARRPVHGRVRPVLPTDRPRPGPLRPEGAGPGTSRCQRPRRRASPTPRGVHPMTTAAQSGLTEADRSVFTGVDVCGEAGLA